MLRRTFIVLLSSLALCLATVPASAQVTLETKIVEGRKSAVKTRVRTAQLLSIAGMDLESGTEQTMEIATEHGQRAADGSIRSQQSITSLKSSMKLPGGVELEFDSSNPDAAAPGTQFDVFLDILKATSKSTWTVVFDKNNRVSAIEGRDAALKDLDETARQLVSKQIDPEYLKEQANVELDRLPSTPVSVGDTWTRSSTARLEMGQNLEFTTQYKYVGAVNQDGKQLDRIDVKPTKVEYTVDEDSPIKIAGSDLKVASSEGQILFDRTAGRIHSSSSKMRVAGEIVFVAQGNNLPGKLDLTLEQHTEIK